MSKGNKTAVWNVMGAVLMAILLVLQFTPFWLYGEAGESCSISSYVWFPSHNGDVENWLEEQVEGFDINQVIGTPILMLFLTAAGAAICLWKKDSWQAGLLPAAAGFLGTVGYLGSAALKLGTGWQWHLLLCIAMAAVGVVNVASAVFQKH